MFMKKALKCLAEILQSGFGAFHKDFSGKTQASNTTDKHLSQKSARTPDGVPQVPDGVTLFAYLQW